jgi:ATP-dependent Zn protease
MKRTKKQLRATAYHEAGHAVIGRVLTLACGNATIRPDYAEMAAGHTITHDPYTCLHEWERRGHVRDSRDAHLHARIITYMAGAEAEKLLLGTKAIGDGDDRKQIELMAEELHRDTDWNWLEPRLRKMTRMLVRRHRHRIERVAQALLARMTLSEKALNKLVGRSVDDVRINAPVLLEMHRRRGTALGPKIGTTRTRQQANNACNINARQRT